MGSNNKLAIVIPAYKRTFLNSALNSISNQSEKKFKVYIGNDASPFELYDIISKYQNEVDIEYKYFEDNLGGNNLSDHWDRCLDMVQDEEWIWLFSDDDELDKHCVRDFYVEMEKSGSEYDIYHFNVKIIDEQGEVISVTKPFPEVISAEFFYTNKTLGRLKSYVVEYVFKKSAFLDCGGFERFDLAWGTDDALWIQLAWPNGIKTISDSKVYWRKSNENISPNKDAAISERKIKSVVAFYLWFKTFAKTKNINVSQKKQLLSLLTLLRVPMKNVPVNVMQKYLRNLPLSFTDKLISKMYIYLYRIMKSVRWS